MHVAEKVTDKYVFFYGGVFSNWKLCTFKTSVYDLGKFSFSSTEQHMMAHKAALFEDFGAFKQIMATNNTASQKAIGRKVKNFDAEVWDSTCKDVVFNGNLAKFLSTQFLTQCILATEDRILVEASPTDCIWGIGLSTNDPRVDDPKNWRGTNWLGEVLMEVRDTIRKIKTTA